MSIGIAYHAGRGEIWEKAHTYGAQAGRKALAQSANRAALEAFPGRTCRARTSARDDGNDRGKH